DLLGRRAGREDLLDAHRLERGDVLRRDDPAAEDHDVRRVLLPEQLEDAREEGVVGSREHAEPDGVRILLDRGRDDLLGGLVEPRGEYLEARAAQRPRADLGPAVVTVETGSGDDEAHAPLGGQTGGARAAR